MPTCCSNATLASARVAGAEANLDEESAPASDTPALATAVGLMMRAAEESEQHRTSFGSRPMAQPRTPFTPRNTESTMTTPSQKLNDLYRQPQPTQQAETTAADEEEVETPKSAKQKKPRFVSSVFSKLKSLLDDELEDDDDTRI